MNILTTSVLSSFAAISMMAHFQAPNSYRLKDDTASRASVKRAIPVTPALMIRNESGASIPLRIERLNVTVSIVGNIALTTMEMTVRKAHPVHRRCKLGELRRRQEKSSRFLGSHDHRRVILSEEMRLGSCSSHRR